MFIHIGGVKFIKYSVFLSNHTIYCKKLTPDDPVTPKTLFLEFISFFTFLKDLIFCFSCITIYNRDFFIGTEDHYVQK